MKLNNSKLTNIYKYSKHTLQFKIIDIPNKQYKEFVTPGLKEAYLQRSTILKQTSEGGIHYIVSIVNQFLHYQENKLQNKIKN